MLEHLTLDQYTGHNIGDGIYAALRENIILLNIKPGEAINIKDISEQLGVSRSPVRDAVMKLAKEGLVDIMPQKGTSVSRIDLHRVEEERFLREALECRILRPFLGRYTADDLTDMEHVVEMQEMCLEKQMYARFLDYDEEFHGLLFRVADKYLCWELTQSMSGHYRRVRLMTLWDGEIVDKAICQHKEMLACIRQREYSALKELVENHCRKINVQEINLFHKYPEYFQNQGSMV